jgi:hypothetical protein
MMSDEKNEPMELFGCPVVIREELVDNIVMLQPIKTKITQFSIEPIGETKDGRMNYVARCVVEVEQ